MKVNPIAPPSYSKTILLAEDDPDDQDFITEALHNIDTNLLIHKINTGKNVLSFLAALPDHQLPQLMVLDYNLPELDGGDLLQTLAAHQRYQPIPKIIWSTSDYARQKVRCLELGASLYMVKPCDVAGIETMARQMLGTCQTNT